VTLDGLPAPAGCIHCAPGDSFLEHLQHRSEHLRQIRQWASRSTPSTLMVF